MVYNNPIQLAKDEQLLEFESLQAFYLMVLNLLWQDFPRGYIDYMLFLHNHTSLSSSVIRECCKTMERSWEESENFCIKVHWTYKVQTRDMLTDLVRKMSRHATHCDFDLRQFDIAWNRFCNTTLPN